VPLAIELAAAWAQTLTPVQMRDRLAQRFNLLVARRRDAPGRHRSLRAAIEWGWELLSPEARDFFAQLSVFRGGWTLEAAEAITGRPDALMLLTELCDRSFLQTEEAQDAVGGDGGEQMRFRMLETLREFADEQVGGDAERAALSERHYQYFLRLTERAEPHLYRPDQALWLRRLEAEHDNLRAAFAGALEREPRRALRLAAALNRFWEVHSHVREASVWVERALAAIPAEASLLRARALDQAGTFAWYLRDFGRMRARLEESIALYRGWAMMASPNRSTIWPPCR
jgi:predicted ATPase